MTVVGECAECYACAERHAAHSRRPLTKACHTDRRRVIPIATARSNFVPRLIRLPVWLHVDSEQSRHAVDAEACCKEWNAGRKLRCEITGEIILSIAYSEDGGCVNLHLERDQVELDRTAELLHGAVVRNRTA